MNLNEEISRVQDLMGIQESGYSKVLRTLRGLEGEIDTLAFITAYNPCSETLSNSENEKRNDELENKLKSDNLSYRKVKGFYGAHEKSFIVNNITKDEAIKFGMDFQQETVIFCEKTEEGMRCEMIVSYPCKAGDKVGDVLDDRNVFHFVNKDTKKNYTELKGRKFTIPFFIDDYINAIWDKSKIEKNPMSEEEREKLSSLIKESLKPEINGKHRWITRGRIKKMLWKYKEFEG